jgi:hypothetical protein
MSVSKHLNGECQHCGENIEFPAEAVGTTTHCPHCGQVTELLLAVPETESSLPTRAIVYTVIATVILAGGLIGTQVALNRARRLLGHQTDAPAPPAPKPAAAPAPAGPAPKDGLQVSSITLEKTAGSSVVYAVGTVRNETDRRRFGVRVECDLFDGTGKKVGSAKDYQQVLGAKAEWQFRARVLATNPVSAKLASVTEDR